MTHCSVKCVARRVATMPRRHEAPSPMLRTNTLSEPVGVPAQITPVQPDRVCNVESLVGVADDLVAMNVLNTHSLKTDSRIGLAKMEGLLNSVLGARLPQAKPLHRELTAHHPCSQRSCRTRATR